MKVRKIKGQFIQAAVAATVVAGAALPAMALETVGGVPFFPFDINTYVGDGIVADAGYSGGGGSANAEVAAFSSILGHNLTLGSTAAGLAPGFTPINLPQPIPTAGLAGAGIPLGNSFLGTAGVFEFSAVNDGASAPVPPELTGVITNLIPVNLTDSSGLPLGFSPVLADNGAAPGSVLGDGIPDQLIPAPIPFPTKQVINVEFGLLNPTNVGAPIGFTGPTTAPMFQVYSDIPVTGDTDTGTATSSILEDDIHFGNDGLPVPPVLDPAAGVPALDATDGLLWLEATIDTGTAVFTFYDSAVLGSGLNPTTAPPTPDTLLYKVEFTASGSITGGLLKILEDEDDLLTSSTITVSSTLFGEIRTIDVNPLGVDQGLTTAVNAPSSLGDFTTGLFGNSGDASFTITFNSTIPEPITAGLGIMSIAGLGAFATRRSRA